MSKPRLNAHRVAAAPQQPVAQSAPLAPPGLRYTPEYVYGADPVHIGASRVLLRRRRGGSRVEYRLCEDSADWWPVELSWMRDRRAPAAQLYDALLRAEAWPQFPFWNTRDASFRYVSFTGLEYRRRRGSACCERFEHGAWVGLPSAQGPTALRQLNPEDFPE